MITFFSVLNWTLFSKTPVKNLDFKPLGIASLMYVVSGWGKFKRRRLWKLAHKPWVGLFLQSISGKVLLRAAGVWHLANGLILLYQFLLTIALLAWRFLVHFCLVLTTKLARFCKTSSVPNALSKWCNWERMTRIYSTASSLVKAWPFLNVIKHVDAL